MLVGGLKGGLKGNTMELLWCWIHLNVHNYYWNIMLILIWKIMLDAVHCIVHVLLKDWVRWVCYMGWGWGWIRRRWIRWFIMGIGRFWIG
jgi:hypothetical protein